MKKFEIIQVGLSARKTSQKVKDKEAVHQQNKESPHYKHSFRGQPTLVSMHILTAGSKSSKRSSQKNIVMASALRCHSAKSESIRLINIMQ
jgi:hypothetical protein